MRHRGSVRNSDTERKFKYRGTTVWFPVPKLLEGQRPRNFSIGIRSCKTKFTEFCTRSTNQPCRFRVINHFGNRAIPNALNRFVNHMKRHQEPLPRLHWMSEAVFDG